MIIKDILFNDINREINGVVKVGDTSQNTLKVELDEYVVTKEIDENLKKFFHNFEHNMLLGSSNVGVWISGFFGSGKSHFLKMMSYLLRNQEVAGKTSTQYFYDKKISSDLKAHLENLNQYNIDTILFNIDSVASINRDESIILRIFARVFYDHLGYFGTDLKIVKLEKHIDSLGKFEEFKQRIQSITNRDWETYRKTLSIKTDPLYQALKETLNMDKEDVRDWLDKDQENLSIDFLVDDIADYIKKQPQNFRLVFLVDEIGQFIGNDSRLMLNLQTLVEDIGVRLQGKVWLIVTSQESIDSLTSHRQNDFSKISARFSTRLPLSSTSVDEVIKKRVLDKKESSKAHLQSLYQSNETIIRNLYTFDQANIVTDMIAYRDSKEFVESYPFAQYQFRLMQNAFLEIRKRGAAGQHMAGGERSMLSGFFEITQSLKDQELGVLVPLFKFYDTFNTFLQGSIRQVIDRASSAAMRHEGLEEYDVDVLKLLFILRHTHDIKSTLDNIIVLMVDNIDAEKIEIKEKVQDSLKRLMRENYVSKHIDEYLFLTDEEQVINREIKEVMVDQAKIVESIHNHIFHTIYPFNKFKYSNYDFDVRRIIDNTAFGSGKLVLKLITPMAENYESGDHAFLLMSSSPDQKQAIVVLSKEYDFISEIMSAAQIKTYIRSRNVSQLPEATQRVISTKQQQATKHEENAVEYLKKAIVNAKVFINNESITYSGSDVKGKFDKILTQHVNDVYSKLNYLNRLFNTEGEINEIIRLDQAQMEGMESNVEAQKEVIKFLEHAAQTHLTKTMADIHSRFEDVPYGYKNIDIAALMVQLLKNEKIKLTYEGNSVSLQDKNIINLLRQKNLISNVRVTIRTATNPNLIRNVISFIREYFHGMPVAENENAILEYLTQQLTQELSTLRNFESQYTFADYPGKKIVVQGRELLANVLGYKNDTEAFFSVITQNSDDLLNWQEDYAEVRNFFDNQKDLFNKALRQKTEFTSEQGFFDADQTYSDKLHELNAILKDEKPYSKISRLNILLGELETIHKAKLNQHITKELVKLDEIYKDVEQFAQTVQRSEVVLNEFKMHIEKQKNDLVESSKITFVTSVISQAESKRGYVLKQLATIAQGQPSTSESQHNKITTLSKSSLINTTVIKSDEDIEKVISDIRNKLKETLKDYDSITIS